MSLLPKSRIVKVEMMIALPISATKEQIDEWIAMECGHSGSMETDNPLVAYEPEAISAPMLTDTGMHLHSEAIDNQDGSHTIRQWTDLRPAWGKTALETVLSTTRTPR